MRNKAGSILYVLVELGNLIVGQVKLNMDRFAGILHKIITGIGLKVPVIHLPDHAGECRIEFPKHYTSNIVELVPGGFEYTLIANGIHKLHFVTEVFH